MRSAMHATVESEKRRVVVPRSSAGLERVLQAMRGRAHREEKRDLPPARSSFRRTLLRRREKGSGSSTTLAKLSLATTRNVQFPPD